MSFLKSIFGGKKGETAQPIARISVAPGQTKEEQDHNRNSMEAELNASRAAREARKVEAETKAAE